MRSWWSRFLTQARLLVPARFAGRGRQTGSCDVTAHQKTETWRAGQVQVLEKIAAGAPLEETLTTLARVVEAQTEGMLCSIVLLDEDGVHVRHGAAPSLPESYTRAIDGLPIGPRAGSCGTAMYFGMRVIVSDILTDPLWEDARALAADNGLRACWSIPVLSSQGRVLGSLALYYREVRSPSADEFQILDAAPHLAGIAIERQRDEAKLRESERRYRLLVENMSDVIWTMDLDLRTTFISPSVERLCGYPAAEYARLPLEAKMTPASVAESRQLLSSSLAEHSGPDDPVQAVTFAHEDLCKDGSTKWCESRISFLRDAAGRPIGIIGATRDISEGKRAEEERQAHLWFLNSMDRVNRAGQGTNDLEQMMGAVLDEVLAIFACDRAWLVHPCDPGAASIRVPMERTRPEYPGAAALGVEVPMDPDVAQTCRALLDADGPVCFGPGAEQPLATELAERFQIRSQIALALYPKPGKPYGFGLHQCSGARVWTPQEQRLLQGIGRRLADALTTLLAYRSLRESEDRYRTLVENLKDVIFTADPVGTLSYLSPAVERLTGFSAGELVGRPFTCLVHADDLPALHAQFALAFAGSQEPAEFRIFHRNGAVRWIRVSGQRLLRGEQPVSITGIITDVTEQKEAEHALVESHGLLNAVVEGTAEAVFVKDLHGRYLMINSAGARVLGRAVEDVIGKHDRELFSPDTVEQVLANDRLVLETGRSQMFEETGTAGGVTRTYLTTKDVYRDSQGKAIGLIGVARDVTDFKRLEEQLRQAQKMEAVGRLAGGIAHDFNNLLTVILGYSEVVLGSLAPADPAREFVRQIVEAGQRAAALTGQLLAFGRKQLLRPEILNLNDVVGRIEEMLCRLIGEDIRLVTALEPGLWPVKADRGQLEQVVVNLAVNARDAMPRGGWLTLSTSNVLLDDQAPPELPPGPYVRLAVQDTGCGIPAEVLPRIFEPFFTTKEVGKGTGLGLATVYGIVKQSGGHVEVSSRPGQGTRFQIYLPRIVGVEDSRALPAARSEPFPSAGTILLVEDEEGVRELASSVLRQSGYTVLPACHGREALAASRQHAGEIELLLTDVVMPEMGGLELARQLALERPATRVLYMSGYSDSSRAAPDVRERFLPKPFTSEELRWAVREALEQERPGAITASVG
jgi:PAS domain S-box-containing protein